MTLQQVKEQVAKKHLYKSWKQLRINQVISDYILDEVSILYAKQVSDKALKDVATKVNRIIESKPL